MSAAKPRTRTPATDIRDQLISAGRAIVERDGEAGFTIRAVATEAGVAPMGVYNRFASKEGLLNAVVTSGFVEFGRSIAATDEDPLIRLANSGRAYRQFAVSNPALYSLMFSTTCTPDPESAGGSFEVLADIVRYAQVAGVFQEGDAGEIAMQIWSCVHGAVSLELAGAYSVMPHEVVGERPSPKPSITAESNYENVLALILRGLMVGASG
ncbi:MAG: TetR/AcrR family transcriptional regulator [Rhodococcus sp.]|nr:TetR/AcrR family transcriptional regulator [Rhodococcus sp. (in: high G+C Gram-positive bacteria)]